MHNHEIAAVFISRVCLGILFFFQGYDAVFKVKLKGVIQTIQPLSSTGVPRLFLILGAYFTSYVQLVGGFFLIIGFLKYYSLYLLGIDLLIASFAFGLTKPMWDMQFFFPRLVLLLFLLVVPPHWDVISVDYWVSIIKFLRSLI